MSEKITLSGVPETMLQTVYARAKESSGRGAIRDRKAEETIGGLQYDFHCRPAEAFAGKWCDLADRHVRHGRLGRVHR